MYLVLREGRGQSLRTAPSRQWLRDLRSEHDNWLEIQDEAGLTRVSADPWNGETEVSGLVEWGDQGYQIN